jgi:hypothetical protein
MFGQNQDIFQTQANQSANTFANPINPAMLNPGWGIDPSLMTPSYSAPYRPQFGGVNPYSAYARPSWAGGVSQILSPFSRDPRWGNPIDNNSAAVDSVATKPFDAMAWAGQRIAMPAIMVGGAMRFLGPGGNGVFGMLGNMAAGKGIAGSFGRGVGAGLGRTFGGALLGAEGAAGLGAAGGIMGGAIGAAALPILAGQGLAYAADEALFQPFIHTRRNTRNLENSFSGVTFGDSRGNSISGRGLGGSEAAGMGYQITRAGIKDMTFSTGEYGNLAHMGMRTGMFDDVSSKKIVDRVKSVAEQVKMIMAISRDPNIQTAIEELAKLHQAGAGLQGGYGSQAATAYRQIGMSASIAGVSVQKMMSQAGAQGQYMYQMNGMTPYLGMVAASNAYAGFANSQRLGLIGQPALARMGGIDGATQSAMGGVIAGAKTPYFQMGLMNKYMYGNGGSAVPGANQSVTNTVGAFGQNVSGDPIMAQGGLALYGDQLASRELSHNGPISTLNQAASLLRERGIAPKGRGGKYAPEQIMVGLQSMGLDQTQAQALMFQAAGQTSSEGRASSVKATNAQLAEQIRQTVNQDGTNGGIVGMGQSVKRGWNSFVGGASRLTNPLAQASGEAKDWLWEKVDDLAFGHSVGRLTDRDRAQSNLLVNEDKLADMGITRGGGMYTSDVGGLNKDKFRKGLGYAGSSGDLDTLADILSDSSSLGSSNFGSYRKLAKMGGNLKSPEAQAVLYDMIKNSGHKGADDLLGSFNDNKDRLLSSASSAFAGAYDSKGKLSMEDGTSWNYDSLIRSGEAGRFLEELEASGGNALMADKLADKYPSLKALAKKQGIKVEDLALKLSQEGLQGQYAGMADAVSKYSLADYQKNPGLLPSGDREAFLSAKTDKGRQSAVIHGAARSRGMVRDPSISNASSLTREQVVKHLQTLRQAGDSNAKGLEDSPMDGDALLKMSVQFDKSVGAFSEAVKIFAGAAGGKKPSSSPDSPTTESPNTKTTSGFFSWMNGRR